jgi:wobble nucleotide-excising tRNase
MQQEQETNIKHYRKEMETISEQVEAQRVESSEAAARIEELQHSVNDAQEKLQISWAAPEAAKLKEPYLRLQWLRMKQCLPWVQIPEVRSDNQRRFVA